MICSISECGRKTVGRGWCRFHYNRWHRFGDPLALPKKTPSGEPFAFLKSAMTNDTDECLPWPYAKYINGYGHLMYEGKVWVASRLMCQMVHGKPPSDDHEAAHSCGNGHLGCISRRHVRWRTSSENAMERIDHGTSNRGSRHGLAKLSEKDVLDIFRRLKKGQPQQSIADRYRIGQVTVSNINVGRNWGWLTGASR